MAQDSQTKVKSGQARRQRRIERRRGEILQAAAQVFADKGYAGTTTKQIAEAADVAEGTLYNYFGGKREILLAIATETEAPMEAAILESGKLENRAAMIEMFEKALDISEAQLPFTRTLISEAWVDDGILQEFIVARLKRVHKRLASFITNRVAAGDFRPIDADLAVRLVMGMFAGLILPSLRGVAPPPSPAERQTLAETVVDLLLDGVRNRNA
jgi:AcrR family transcriptional regulator